MTRHLLFLSLLLPIELFGQNERTPVDSLTATTILEKSATDFPKFYREFKAIKQQDSLIKRIIFIETKKNSGPAFASPNGTISIVLDFLEHPKPNFDDNRLIVVLYHELGHLHYYATTPRNKWNPEDSEKAAFEYSLLRTKQLAEAGDCQPLRAGVNFMKLRSQGTNLSDAHVRALKRMVEEPLYAGYLQYVREKCGS